MGALVFRLVDAADDDSLRLIFANEAASRLLRMNLSPCREAAIRELFPEVAREQVRALAEVARAGGPTRPRAETSPGTGHIPPGAFSRLAVPLPGACAGVLFEHVTDELRAGREVRTLNAFLDSIIENIPAMVFVKDAETLRFERFNRAGEDLLGMPREKLLGKNDFDFFPEDQARFFQEKDHEVLKSRRLLDIPEEPIQTPQGQRWLHTKKIPILGPDGEPRYLLGISEDITDRKNADEALREAHRQLEQRVTERTAEFTQVNDDLRKQIAERERAEEALRRSEEELRQSQKMEAIGRLAGGIAHDFNNLLSIILSYSAMMMDSLSPADPLRADAEQIAIAGQRARDLTRQLLAFSRRQLMRPEVLDLAEIVRGLEPMLRRVLGEDIELTISLGQPTSMIKADPGQLQQIIMNLVVNARDAMPEGGKLWIETADFELGEGNMRGHASATPGPHVVLTVSDTGVGLDEETRARIFEPFFTTKPKGKGTGLGLSTVLGIVQQSGGHVIVESTPGHGAAFRMFLPRTSEARTAPLPVREPRPAMRTRGSETILLVEDEGQLRVLARDILRGAGYQVFDAPNAAEAIKSSLRHAGPIHLLVTDVVMPHLGGRELARRLGAERPRMRVLYMSGYTDDAIVQHGIVDPSIAFLPKPITPDTLLGKVRETLDAP
jgi:two-component system, cell cycle sensor histidine kinase and response regulator CckA